jgi:hypothetical protein
MVLHINNPYFGRTFRICALTEHHAVKVYWGSGFVAPRILELGINGGGQLHATAALLPRERAPVTHWIGGRMGPRAGLDAVVKRKFPAPAWT